MLYTIAVVLIILWLLGIVTSYTMGGVLHILLVIALVMVLANFISGRRRFAQFRCVSDCATALLVRPARQRCRQ